MKIFDSSIKNADGTYGAVREMTVEEIASLPTEIPGETPLTLEDLAAQLHESFVAIMELSVDE